MLTTEADVVRSLARGTMSLTQVYALCEQHTDVSRANGHDVIHGRSDTRWKRRARCALQALRHSGAARRVDRSTWLIDGTSERPRQAILVYAGGTLAEVDLRLQHAVDLLADLDGPADLIVADPPYGLNRGTGRSAGASAYRRNPDKVVGGYVDVAPSAYEDFTHSWLTAATRALRPAGQIAIITGPQRSAVVHYVAEQCGLLYVNQVIARKEFALRAVSRFAHAHWTITILTKPRIKNALGDPKRTFNIPADLPKAASGADYPLDLWLDSGRGDRPGLLRYDNALPERPVRRLVSALSNEADLVVDPFLGSGTTAKVCHELGRRFTGGDVNAGAIRFALARMLDEHLWPAEDNPALFSI
jgi:DNA modification methylase